MEVAGVVLDPLGKPVADAKLSVGKVQATTDETGHFILHVPPGRQVLNISHAEFRPMQQSLDVAGPITNLSFQLEPILHYPESIVVQAIRADDSVPVTKKDIPHEEIEKENYGQEMPFFLMRTPSTNSYSDSGLGSGYSYFTMRGIQQTRINMTVDGVPLNDPEESAVYFANFGDFTSAVESIQIQRGVGTSTVGAASYGGSINFASLEPSESRDFGGEVGTGSYASHRAAVTVDSGRLDSGLAMYARLSYQDSNGFKDHSGVNQRSLYYGGTWQGERSFLKLFGFNGREKTQLAFLATEESILEQDLRYNALQPEETDNFGQDLFQAQYTHLLGNASSIAVQGYYNGAQGWFRLWDDPVAKNALLQYSINGHFVGTMVTYATSFGAMNLTAGAHANYFTRDHFQDIEDQRQYENTGFKNEANSFVKLNYDVNRWNLYADAQVRYARFRYEGDVDLGSVDWTFFNPKIGARYRATDSTSVYASVGHAGREPARQDMLLGEDNATVPHDLEAVKPESVTDFEAGVNYHAGTFEISANMYAMEFRNEIALTGELSEIGLPLRMNVDRSYRRGVEFDLAWQALPQVLLTTNGNLSHNRIRNWTQFYDVYDESGNYVSSQSVLHTNVNPLLTPHFILNQGVEWIPNKIVRFELDGRYVSRSYLDNTNNDDFRTPSYFNADANVQVSLERWWSAGSPRIRLQVNNIFDNDHIWPSGYSYLFFIRDGQGTDTLQGIPYFYPLATRSAFIALDFQL